MEILIVGLGRMGQNIAKRLLKNGHQVFGFDKMAGDYAALKKLGGKVLPSLKEAAAQMSSPKIAWVMVPHGNATNDAISELFSILGEGDLIIDGGNSHFSNSALHAEQLKSKNIAFLDIGVSGGIFGLERGFCLMVGGEKKSFLRVEPILKSLCPGENSRSKTTARKQEHSTAHEGYYFCGQHGAGHFVKMVHNAIEYGMMQSFAEGIELLDNSSDFSFDIREITELWRRGSVIESWLLDLISEALHKDPRLDNFSGQVPDSGEGRWALIEAIKQNTPAPNLSNSLFTRFRSRQKQSFSEKTLSAMRKEFGGHKEA